MTGEAGRLFKPLAYTKTFALIASIIVALAIIPPVAHLLFGSFPKLLRNRRGIVCGLLTAAGLIAFQLFPATRPRPHRPRRRSRRPPLHPQPHPTPPHPRHQPDCRAFRGRLLADRLDAARARPQHAGAMRSFVILLIGGSCCWLSKAMKCIYPRLLRWCLTHKGTFPRFYLLA